MAKLDLKKSAGFNAGRTLDVKLVKISEIEIDPEISGLFPIDDETLQGIIVNLKEFGFDKSQPVVLWKGKNILVDGHTRFKAVQEAGLAEVIAMEREFKDKTEAVLYAFNRQRLRRNLSGANILIVAQTILANNGGAKDISEALGMSLATSYQAITVLKEASKEDLESIKKGEASVKKVYTKNAEQNPKQTRTKQKTKTPSKKPKATIGNSEAFSFLKSAVTMFFEADLSDEADMLTEHFAEYYDVSLEDIQAELEDSTEGIGGFYPVEK